MEARMVRKGKRATTLDEARLEREERLGWLRSAAHGGEVAVSRMMVRPAQPIPVAVEWLELERRDPPGLRSQDSGPIYIAELPRPTGKGPVAPRSEQQPSVTVGHRWAVALCFA